MIQAIPAAIDPDANTGRFNNRFVAAFNGMIEFAAMAVMAALALMVFINAVGRYAFASPLPWTEDVVINLMVWLSAFGIIIGGMRQSLICCDILTARLNSGLKRALAIFSGLLGAGIMFYCTWLTFEYLMFFGGDKSPVLKIPKFVSISGLFFALVGLGSTMLASLLLRKA